MRFVLQDFDPVWASAQGQVVARVQVSVLVLPLVVADVALAAVRQAQAHFAAQVLDVRL